MDKWGLWFALVIVGSIIAYGLISGLLKEDESLKKKPNEAVHGGLTPPPK